MKLEDISPIFLTNIQHKVFGYAIHRDIENKIKVVKLECIKPTPQLKRGEIYWGYEYLTWFSFIQDLTYKIFLPILGARKYSPDRFRVLDCMELSSKDFTKNTFKQLNLNF